jgi:hypothetical protein
MALAAMVFSGLVGIVLSHYRQSSTTCPDMAWVGETKLFYFHASSLQEEGNIIESVATQYENPRRLYSLLDISLGMLI